MNKGEQAMSDINESLGVRGSSVLNTIKNKEFLKQVEAILDDSTYVLDRNSAGDCEEAIAIARSANILRENVKKIKKLRYHVDLAPEMGKDLTLLAKKMEVNLSSLIRMLLVDKWRAYKDGGIDYVYIGVKDKYKAPSIIQ